MMSFGTLKRFVALTFCVLLGLSSTYARNYTVTVSNKSPTPPLTIRNAPGQGYSPCNYTFNPAWLDAAPGLNESILIVRAAQCPESFGGGGDHLMYAPCYSNGTCGDLNPMVFPFESESEDPRVFYYEGYWWLYYFASGPGQNTVYLRKSNTPLDPNSWTLVASQLPWHRNGCVILRDDGNHYVIFGESGGPKVGPLPGIGIASTRDFVNYTYLNSTWLEPDPAQEEIVLEAASTPVKLSTGDYLHLYAAGTTGWVPKGNYTTGALILDANDPTNILQRSTHHVFVPTMEYEIGDGIWPVQRNRTLFVTSLVPIEGQIDTFRAWYGAADANVATAIVTVTYE